jgi:hypothetical protein
MEKKTAPRLEPGRRWTALRSIPPVMNHLSNTIDFVSVNEGV